MGTRKAFAKLCSVVSEGDVFPFSILESIPIERPVSTDKSATVISCFRLKNRICLPIAFSKTFSRGSVVLWGS